MEKAKTLFVGFLCVIAFVLVATPISYTFLGVFGKIEIAPKDIFLVGFCLWVVCGIGCILAISAAHDIIFPREED